MLSSRDLSTVEKLVRSGEGKVFWYSLCAEVHFAEKEYAALIEDPKLIDGAQRRPGR